MSSILQKKSNLIETDEGKNFGSKFLLNCRVGKVLEDNVAIHQKEQVWLNVSIEIIKNF